MHGTSIPPNVLVKEGPQQTTSSIQANSWLDFVLILFRLQQREIRY
jgi:hypothetical protein